MLRKFYMCCVSSFSKYHSDGKASTIFALSSGYGKCGVAIVRISGPDSKQVLLEMAGFKKLPEPRRVYLKTIKNSVDNSILDRGLVVWFPGPNSFTGEDCCELQVHGGKAVTTAVLKSLSEITNLRPAMPGEFTKRAFYNGKMDLTEVEGLADLIDAETEVQRKQAVNQMNGALSKVYNSWRKSLTRDVAQIEAFIDFSESENLEEDMVNDTKASTRKLLESVRDHLADGRRGERLRDGVQTVILGAPNVGKSSLLNILCRKEEAIVSPIAGTTRDIVTSTLDIGGYPLVIKDTAGLRQRKIDGESTLSKDATSDPVEIEGISRAINAAKSADLVLLVMDPSHLPPDKPPDQSLLDYCKELGVDNLLLNAKNKLPVQDEHNKDERVKCLTILNKVDLLPNRDGLAGVFDVMISCKEEEGVKDLIDYLSLNLKEMCDNENTLGAMCNQVRHRHCLNEVISSLETALAINEPDLVAHHMRQALYSLGKITGQVSTEQILDVIFKQFCVGK